VLGVEHKKKHGRSKGDHRLQGGRAAGRRKRKSSRSEVTGLNSTKRPIVTAEAARKVGKKPGRRRGADGGQGRKEKNMSPWEYRRRKGEAACAPRMRPSAE